MSRPDSVLLKLSVSKNLIDQELAKEINNQSRSEDRPALDILWSGVSSPAYRRQLAEGDRTLSGTKGNWWVPHRLKIGQGGMGAVDKAVQLSMDREVALKVIPPEFSKNKDACERFIRERRVAGKINHPNVITCIDVGQDGKILYMALELVLGGDVDQAARAAGGRLPERRALEMVRDAAHGLEAIHTAGLIHRDIKPGNIFLTDAGVAKLANLGLARSTMGDDRMTQSGATVGTPAFMSPEQADGAGDIDIRSDIYALGATLFALICGHPPFRGSSPWAVVAAVLKDPFSDPRSKGCSPAVAAIIERACVKDRLLRFQTPHDLVLAIEAIFSGASSHVPAHPIESLSTVPRSSAQSAPQGVRRISKPKRNLGISPKMLTVGGVVLIGGIVAVALSGGPPAQSTSHAAEPTAAQLATPTTPPPENGNTNVSLAQPQTQKPVVEVSTKHDLKDYRAQFPNETAALQAGLTENAPPEIIAALERDVLARAQANVERLTRILQQPSLGQRELNDVDAALAKSKPPERHAFAELKQILADLGDISHTKKALLSVAAPAPQASPQIVGIHSKVSLWSGEPGPKPAIFSRLSDDTARIPSPWPFFIDDAPSRFAAAVKTRNGDRKDVFTLQLTFPTEQVRKGGIFLTLNALYARTELLLNRVDLPPQPPQKLIFSDRENWQGFAYRVEDTPGNSVTIQISDADELSGGPFWLGSTGAISNGDPATLAAELSPSPLLTPNLLMDWKPLLESLKAAARGRKLEEKWFDHKILNTNFIKILGPDTISATKLNAALRLRRDMPDVENQVEVVNLHDGNEIRKLFALKANPGLLNQKNIPAPVFLVTNGIETTIPAADWAKHVRSVNGLFRVGDPKFPATGFIPV